MISTGKEVPLPKDQTTEERWDLVRRVAASATFVKAQRLSSLLVFVCDLTLTGRAAEINEQKIGEAVFGRARDYDSSVDGIVRAQASRLRSRLDLYFKEEGIAEPMRIVIPRGGYVPYFEAQPTRVIDSSSSEAVHLTPPKLPDEKQSEGIQSRTLNVPLSWSLVSLLAITVLILATLLIKKSSPAGSGTIRTTSNPMWSKLFLPEQQTLVIFADSGLVMYQGVTRQNLGLPEYLNGGYRTETPGKASFPPVGGAIDLANRRYTSLVDLEIIRALDHISGDAKGRLELRYARDVTPNELKQGNVVLLGAAEANPWVELFEHNMNFAFSDDRLHRVYSVINRVPKGSEPRQWDAGITDTKYRVYGVMAYLPNLNGAGNALIIEGTGMSGTECAWDFASDNSL